MPPEGRNRSYTTSRTYGGTDRDPLWDESPRVGVASFAICSRAGVSGRASRGRSKPGEKTPRRTCRLRPFWVQTETGLLPRPSRHNLRTSDALRSQTLSEGAIAGRWFGEVAVTGTEAFGIPILPAPRSPDRHLSRAPCPRLPPSWLFGLIGVDSSAPEDLVGLPKVLHQTTTKVARPPWRFTHGFHAAMSVTGGSGTPDLWPVTG